MENTKRLERRKKHPDQEYRLLQPARAAFLFFGGRLYQLDHLSQQ